MKKSNTTKLLTLSLLALSLTACTSVKRELGVGRNSPDEFTVVKRAPLTLPPEYSLRPPASADDPQAGLDASAQAKAALLGSATSAPVAKGSEDEVFLAKMGANTANPDIRKIIDEENGYISLQNRTVADRLIHWDDEDAVTSLSNAPSSVVDPKAEAERLQKNQAEGKPVNEGEVPTIEKKKGTIDKIF